MPTIHDEEFGNITIRRNIRSRQVRVRVASNGTLSASLPTYAPLFLVKRLIKNSRGELRRILDQAKPDYDFSNGMKIGKTYTLRISRANSFSVTRRNTTIFIQTPSMESISNLVNHNKIREVIAHALRAEAKKILPDRLDYYARKFGFKYSNIKFSHASGRWGSCSSSGTIGLNIALMKLPYELIDYVIVHELAHTKEMNHSRKFWSIVRTIDSDFQQHRRELKLNNPSV